MAKMKDQLKSGAKKGAEKAKRSGQNFKKLLKGTAGTSIFTKRTRKPNFFLSVAINTIRITVIAILLLCISGAGSLVGLVKAYVETAPTLSVSELDDQDRTSFVYDVNGNLITTLRNTENRIWASYDEIPQQLINAFVAIEDTRFFSHNGVDIKRLVGAFVNNMQNSSTQGGSTITQQLIKMRVLSPERTYKRKIQEAYLAMELESEYSKEQILESYLNTINLGDSNYGVKAAAQDYFGKDLDELTLRECATLAGCTQNPYSYNPRKNYYTREKPEQTDNRTDTVLMRMYHVGFITKEEYEAALADQLVVKEESEQQDLYEMPHFVEYVIYDVVSFMLQQRDLEDNTANRREMERALRTGGYHVYTTCDPTIQKTVESTIYNWKNYPRMANSADSQTTDTSSDGTITTITQPQVSAVVIDQHSGEIKAMVGSRTPPQSMKELNRAYQSSMPVGSSIKPLAVYGPALDLGAGAASIVYDIAAPIEGWVGGQGYPSNSGGGNRGAVTLRESIVRSINVSSARTLLERVGVETSKDYLLRMGVSASHIEVTPSGLALGSSGLTTLELAGGFSAIANDGIYQQPISFTRVEDEDGNVVIDATALRATRQVFEQSTAWMLVDMLEDAVDHGTGTRAKIPGMTVAGKTGTNQDNKGVTFAGMTPYYTAAVYVGSDEYKSLSSDSQGGRSAAPIWQDFMAKIHSGLMNMPILEESAEEAGLVQATVCAISGKKPGSSCPSTATDYFRQGTVPEETCDMHVSAEICITSGMRVGPYCPESTHSGGAAIVIPQDNVLAKLPLATIQRFFPGATLGTSLGNGQTCTVHTAEWAAQNSGLISQAGSLVATAQAWLPNLSEGDAALVQSAITQLQNCINTGAAYENTKAAYDALYNTLSTAIAATPQVPATPPGGEGGEPPETE